MYTESGHGPNLEPLGTHEGTKKGWMHDHYAVLRCTILDRLKIILD